MWRWWTSSWRKGRSGGGAERAQGDAPVSGTEPPPSAPGDVRVGVRVSDQVVAKVVAYHAARVPGVVALRSRLSQAVVLLAGRVMDQLRDRPKEVSTEGVKVEVEGSVARIELDVVTRLGYPCLEVGRAIQSEVEAKVKAHAGLGSVVSVNIVDIELCPEGFGEGSRTMLRPAASSMGGEGE
jgi:uncharacterized alkaline shock family protein YloU